MYEKKKVVKIWSVIFLLLAMLFCNSMLYGVKGATVSAMPFYDLQPKNIVKRASFYTSYPSSSDERKSNIALACKSLNNTLVDVNGEFSFNKTVGARTEKNGYKTSKIIVGGEFVDGVGGGVCQVSTTLYNAVLLAGLKVTECHPHSLPVSYIAPSFDAMVNSGYADLRFINNTHNPIIIKTFADGTTLRIEIWGEPLTVKYSRQSIVTGEIPAPTEQEVLDEKGEYPMLYQGDRLVIRYSKTGLTSEGFIVATKNGKPLSVKKIRSDKYNAQRGLVVIGNAEKPPIDTEEPIDPDFNYPNA
ncbi:MAG: VanW family protein [Clostridia bacterium]|nr:VanW family protein [Clostridia bacterium]